MADAKITQLTADTTPLSTDITVMVSDPGGTPVTKKVTLANFLEVYNAMTETLTNKRITPRTDSVTSSATPTINTDTTDFFRITALAVAINTMSTNLSGTPTIGQKLIIRFLDNSSPQAITWGASFASRGATLPTTTVAGKYMYVGLIWNDVATVWDCVAVATEA